MRGAAEDEWNEEERQPLLAHDVGVALCHPAGWSTSTRPGRSVAAIAEDGSRGVAVVRVHQPRAPAGSDFRSNAVDRAIRLSSDILPGGIGPGAALESGAQPTVLNRNDSLWRGFSYPGGIAAAAASDRGTGTITVVILYGPPEWMASQEAGALAVSLVPF